MDLFVQTSPIQWTMIFSKKHFLNFLNLKQYSLRLEQFLQQVRPAEQDKNLFCFHLHHNDPYLILGPFKYERLLANPEIGLFHDFASEFEMETMKARAR